MPGRAAPWAMGVMAAMALVALLIFVLFPLWTVAHSLTGSRLLPNGPWVGLAQYERLWTSERWLISVGNLAIYAVGLLSGALGIGAGLAVLLDRRIRAEGLFRAVLLYPYALSFVVTGLAWQWMLNPTFGLPGLALLSDPDLAIHGVVMAGLWQGSGIVAVLILSGLRAIDDDIWKAARLDGIAVWKTYLFIVFPMLRGVLATATVLVLASAIKLFDLVVALTGGGPGLSTEVPAKYVYDMMFENQNLGQGFAASTMMLTLVLVVMLCWAVAVWWMGRRRDHR
ncbi:carbohydrate ABC transporter permease [Actibacterium ureilyticum]|uniref:carbohydrate ABC transporter permease n=1 Tax=Actibacterium ureilyticum TaxID=1590614 RepID=UPI001FE48037|nr:sugar ABC transporter permease [Actibacterium ureilyticum]